ncbi:unnamed protein product [Clonostachys rosea]|uniref:Cytochrome P450 n=1 Tax=Bionectria ochroleuca TaxID=29856 RepID=A0ABY6UXW4_BIOOC|nr:unnamed protein product [Clonostachys rosea]
MALTSLPWDTIGGSVTWSQLLSASAALGTAYFTSRVVYNLYFHPLSKYPGPKLAAISDLWWAYASTSGRYPWIIEDVLKTYGDVVRIAPNELVFITPQAAKDIYLAQEKNLELFVQVGYDALDTGDGGITGETNPVRHREIAKKLAPAFSSRNLRAKEAAIHKHIDLFVHRMKEYGGDEKGADMRRWAEWLGLDLSADMTYCINMGHLQDMKDSLLVRSTFKLNMFILMSQIVRKFRILTPLAYLTIPPSVWFDMPELLKLNTSDVQTRLKNRDNMEHLDYFEQLVPINQPIPQDQKELYHLQNVAWQLLLASWQPLANQFYSLILFLLKDPNAYATLAKEVREEFSDYDAIKLDSVERLKYLQGCANESFRLHQETTDGLPRISPGSIVDGTYIPRGISYFSAARSPRYFMEPLEFRPERWLTLDHPSFNPIFKDDNLKASKPFSQGPRGCPGGPIASATVRLLMAKVLWQFDLEFGAGQRELSFERDFKFLAFWDKPEFRVRFKPVKRC